MPHAISPTNQAIYLRSRPVGEPEAANFELRRESTPEPGAGEFLYRTLFLSLDPYLRGRMNEGKSYVPPFPIGGRIVSGFVGEVVRSQHPDFREGEKITGLGDWALYSLSRGTGIQKVAPGVPLPAVLGVLGMPGLTAYVGLLDIGRARSGETVVVSAASGAVGSVVGQLAKFRGCRAIGLAGSEEKCRYVVEELGFDACIDYKKEKVSEALARHCPQGIDVYFDNVGGEVLKAAMGQLADHARIALCGMISEYNASRAPEGPNLRPLLVHKASIQGFIVSEHADRYPAFVAEMAPLLREGRLKYREDIVRGLENAPEAFIGLLRGKNFGKLLVQVAE